MGMPGTTELLIILAIVVLLFGAKKIPDLAKGLGQGIKNFKKSVKDDEEDAEVKEIVSKEPKEEEPIKENKEA
jgi:sec-independent protein translocase protein TatA